MSPKIFRICSIDGEKKDSRMNKPCTTRSLCANSDMDVLITLDLYPQKEEYDHDDINSVQFP